MSWRVERLFEHLLYNEVDFSREMQHDIYLHSDVFCKLSSVNGSNVFFLKKMKSPLGPCASHTKKVYFYLYEAKMI